MYFKKLELIGFKSFADKTVLNFEPGITAVVGPNGCGKSNIFDSIRWVLGEQSIKSLRGSKMEDVIFNGTTTKPSLGFAEVSLMFSNENKFLPIEYEEVVITRRIFRSGESEYLINKNPVRLKDITELFLGTGITSESYSLVEQGKIDLVLSSRPEDRRLIFDEAAGITLYKSKKREALRKLEDTDNNLLRVSDIITEIKRQITSVERQAQRAKRYQELYERLKEAEVKLAAFEIDLLKNQQDELEGRIKDFQDKNNAQALSMGEFEKKYTKTQEELEGLNRKTSQIQSEHLRIEGTIERDRQHISLNKERIQDELARTGDLEQQKKQIQERILQQRKNLDAVSKELESQEKLQSQKQIALKERQILVADLDLKTKDAKNRITKSQPRLLDLATQITKARNEINRFNSEMSVLMARKRRLDLELAKTREELSQVQEKYNSAVSQHEDNENAFGQLQEACRNLEHNIEEQKNRLNLLKEDIILLDKEKSMLQSQKEFLSGLKSKYDEMPQKLRAVIFSEGKIPSGEAGFIGKVIDSFDISPGHKQMLKSHFTNIAELSGANCEIKLIPLDVKAIQSRLDQTENKLGQANAEKQAQELNLEQFLAQVKALQAKSRAQELQVANSLNQKDNIKEQLDKLESEVTLVGDELSETNGNIDSLAKKVNEANSLLNLWEVEEDKTKLEIENSQNLITQYQENNQNVLIEITQIEVQINSFVDKRSSISNTFKLLSDTVSQDEMALASIEKEIKGIFTKKKELEDEIIGLEEDIKKTNLNFQELDRDFKEIEKNKENYIELVKASAAEIQKVKEVSEKIKSELHNLQMHGQDINFRRMSLKERLLNTYKVDIDGSTVQLDRGIDPTVLNNQINELKTKVDNFGTVNLVAIEEHEELKTRFEFLTKQQEDLLTAKDSLHKAITKINQTTRKMFTETFQKIEAEFRNYFKLLFGGGDAKLILIDPEDVLESGIEIICQPPGKKLQNVSLLSGGEKALSAIALIFSIFKIKPSPFCVLDEIDSALDESNVSRFGRLLKEFTKTSQFIVITHNKKTIAHADVMYGITMQESGVSKIVSVKFADHKPKKGITTGSSKDGQNLEVEKVN
ncbi:MAG: AAA family ATPase [Candidatus Omnitrophota bacterium]